MVARRRLDLARGAQLRRGDGDGHDLGAGRRRSGRPAQHRDLHPDRQHVVVCRQRDRDAALRRRHVGGEGLPAAGARTVNVAAGPDFGSVVEGKRFGAIVESTGTTPAQIVVERAMYSDAGGVKWAAGTNAPAIKLRSWAVATGCPSPSFLADGARTPLTAALRPLLDARARRRPKRRCRGVAPRLSHVGEDRGELIIRQRGQGRHARVRRVLVAAVQDDVDEGVGWSNHPGAPASGGASAGSPRPSPGGMRRTRRRPYGPVRRAQRSRRRAASPQPWPELPGAVEAFTPSSTASRLPRRPAVHGLRDSRRSAATPSAGPWLAIAVASAVTSARCSGRSDAPDRDAATVSSVCSSRPPWPLTNASTMNGAAMSRRSSRIRASSASVALDAPSV